MHLDKENIPSHFKENNTINIREEIEKYVFYWKWFVLGVFLSLVMAFLYLRYATPQYIATTTIMIKDNRKSGVSKELETFKDLGIIGGGSSNNTDNEIEIIKSRKIIGNVIDSLNLDNTYYIEGRIKKAEVYKNSPILIKFISRDTTTTTTTTTTVQKDTLISVSIKSDTTFDLKDSYGKLVSSNGFNKPITSGLGTFKIVKTATFSTNTDFDIFIHLHEKSRLIGIYRKRINITVVNEDSSVLRLSLKASLIEKAEDFLNELIRQYNIDAIRDKSEVSKKTRDFIRARIATIGRNLESIQDNVEKYKTKNKITGLSREGELALETATKNNEKLVRTQTQLSVAKWIKESLDKQTSEFEILPQNLGISDQNISAAITKYNLLISKKDRLSVNAGLKNPQLIQYIREIAILRSNLIKSISNLIYSLNSQFNELNKEADKVYSKVSSIPVLERGFIDIARQQEIVSDLYSYLLKKKEETAISLAVVVNNAKIIDVAYGSKSPVSPKKRIILLVALLLGVLVPFIVIYLMHLLDNKVHNKRDIENNVSIPYLGDIPKSEAKEKIIVGYSFRSSGSEAFRVIKTNLDFMLANKTKKSKFIFVTS
ncbi:MAG: GumC family protein, partial [Polaribacter sp.]